MIDKILHSGRSRFDTQLVGAFSATLSRRIINLAASGTIKCSHEGEDDDSHIFLLVSAGPKKITRLVRIQSEHIARCGTWTKPSSRVPSRSNSPGHHPQWVLTHPESPFPSSCPPPSTTFQFILSCWLARFTTKFPLARRSSLCTLYLLLPLFCFPLSLSFSSSLSSRLLSSLDIWSSFLISSSFFRFNISPFTTSNIYSGPYKIFT